MGLLNQIIGGLAGNALGRSPLGGSLGRSLGGGNSRVMMALLPVILGMLTNRQRSNSMGGANSGPGAGGLGSLAGMGGLGGLLQQFSQRGYGQEADSWVSTGPNRPLPPEVVSNVFDQSQLAEIASQAGISEDEARSGLSELLPEVVDHFTPGGQVPAQDELLSSIDDYERQLPR